MHDERFEHFLDEGLITSIIRPIKSGKEASVHLCRGNPSTTGERLLALKTYHPLNRRGNARVELGSAVRVDLLERQFRGHRRPVAAVGGHRAVRVAAEDDPRRQGDLLPREAVRVALAVPALVA